MSRISKLGGLVVITMVLLVLGLSALPALAKNSPEEVVKRFVSGLESGEVVGVGENVATTLGRVIDREGGNGLGFLLQSGQIDVDTTSIIVVEGKGAHKAFFHAVYTSGREVSLVDVEIVMDFDQETNTYLVTSTNFQFMEPHTQVQIERGFCDHLGDPTPEKPPSSPDDPQPPPPVPSNPLACENLEPDPTPWEPEPEPWK